MKRLQAGFTLIELMIVVVILAVLGWVAYKYLIKNQKEVNGPPEIVQPHKTDDITFPRRMVDSVEAMNVMAVFIIGIIMLAGVAWQIYLMAEKDNWDRKPPRRLIPPVIAGAIIFFGVLVFCIIACVDERKGMPLQSIFVNSGKALVFLLLISLKSYFGPVTGAFTLSCVVYYFFSYGEIHAIPLIQATFDWVFSSAPRWVSIGYVILITGYSFGSSAYDSFDL